MCSDGCGQKEGGREGGREGPFQVRVLESETINEAFVVVVVVSDNRRREGRREGRKEGGKKGGKEERGIWKGGRERGREGGAYLPVRVLEGEPVDQAFVEVVVVRERVGPAPRGQAVRLVAKGGREGGREREVSVPPKLRQ